MTLIKKLLLLTIVTFCIIFEIGCTKENTNYLDNPIAIVYKNNTPYLININQELFSLEEYDEVMDDFNDYIIVKKDNKYGIIKNNGQKLCECIFDKIEPVRENKAVAVTNGEYVIINPYGEIQYTFPTDFVSESYFSQNHLVIRNENHFGYLLYDTKKNEYTPLELKYNYASPYVNNYGIVAVNDSYNIYETDEQGNETEVIKETVYLENLKYNYVEINDKLLFDTYQFDFADNFYNDWARVGVYKDTKYYIKGRQKPSTLYTLVYSYVGTNGTYLNYYYYTNFLTTITYTEDYQTKSTVKDVKIRKNDKIEVPYAQNFHDGYAVIGNYYSLAQNSDKLYKAFMIIDEFGSMDFVDAIYSKTSYYCGYEEVTENIVQVEVYQPTDSHNYFIEVAKLEDTIILRSAQTFSSTIWSYYFNLNQEYYENNELRVNSSFEKINFNPYISINNLENTDTNNVPLWLEEYSNEYYPGSIEGTGLKISISEIASPYEADPIHKSNYIGDVNISRVRLIKKDTTGIIGFKTYKKYNKVSDSDLTYVEFYFIIDPVYDKIIY